MNAYKPIILRMLLSVVISMLAAWVINEGSYQLLRDPAVRDEPRQVLLTIPDGTAAKIAAGQPVFDLPQEMTFVEGDLLVIRNQDTVSHQLGPVWVPAQSSGVLQLGGAANYSYTCSFETSKTFGVNVEPRWSMGLRIEGALEIGLPSAAIMGLYSFLVFPIKKKPAKPGLAAIPGGESTKGL